MAITVTHTTPADDSFSAAGALAWDANHSLTGVGTMAEQNANNVAITGGTMSGVAITGYVPTTRTISTSTGLTGGGDLSADRTIAFADANVGAWAASPTSANLRAAMTDETGTGSLVFGTSPTLSGPTIDGASPFINMTPTTAPAYQQGRLFYDSAAYTLNYYNDNTQMSVNIGQEQIVRVRNQTGADLTNGTVVYINGATGNTPTIAKAIATAFSTADIIGVLTTDIANNGFGYVTISGLVNGLDLSAFTDGQAVFLSPTTPGAFTATEPTNPNYSVQVGIVLRANPSVGTLLVSIQMISVEVSHIVGTLPISGGGTGQTTANAAFNALVPSQTGNSGKYLTTDGTNTSWATNPLGTVTSVSGTGTVNGLTLTGTVTTSGSLTLGGTLDLSSPPAIGGTAPNTGAFTSLVATSGIGGGAF